MKSIQLFLTHQMLLIFQYIVNSLLAIFPEAENIAKGEGGVLVKRKVVPGSTCFIIAKYETWEADTARMFLKILENPQENICARFLFLIKLQAWGCIIDIWQGSKYNSMRPARSRSCRQARRQINLPGRLIAEAT